MSCMSPASSPAVWHLPLPDLSGIRAVVTGANSGLGLVTARELARAGAHVVLACRDLLKGDAALGQIRVGVPGADVALLRLDLADLASVRAFTDELMGTAPGLDPLVNNAGVMAIPRHTTADGFELQLGTNHLGHFALTARLMPALLGHGPARVVTVSSFMHTTGHLNRDDLMGERSYRPWRAYGQAKLANLLFATELQRRAEAVSAPLLSLAAHPGYASTNLQAVGPRMSGSRLGAVMASIGNRLFAQPAAAGALPTLRAATDPDVHGFTYFGPGGLFAMRGAPVPGARTSRAARNAADAAWLWQRSAELTGVQPVL